jgi:aspartyl-tRNA(Asn)/glutamyl-tRNA(Gln) amidotransferase subunit A
MSALNSAHEPVFAPPAAPDDLCSLSAIDLRALYRRRAVSPVEVLSAVLERVSQLEPAVGAFFTLTGDRARRDAQAAEVAYARGETDRPLLGIPLSVKDLIPTSGIRTTYGSAVFEHHVPEHDAPAVERVLAAGAVMLGKTATSEFGWKSAPESPLFAPTRNPWDTTRTSAGSSGGAAVAVATGMGPLAIGTDGGGSIRQPASFCGVVGLKPSAGLVPAAPPSPIADVDHTGPLARTVRDVALLLDVLAGEDHRDWSSISRDPASYLVSAEGGVRELRIAWSADLGYAGCDPEVAAVAERAARHFEDLGCSIEVAHPDWLDPASMFETLVYELWGASMSDYLPIWETRMDPGLVEVIRGAGSATTLDIAEAARARRSFQQEAASFFTQFDLLLTPTMAVKPFGVNSKGPPAEVAGRRVSGIMQWTPFTFPFNITGQPAISVPAGWTAEGLPVGLQIAAPWRQDGVVLRAAAAYEAINPWGQHWPPIILERRDHSQPERI